MKTNDFWAKMTKAAFAFATVVMMGMAFTACSGSDDDDNGGGGVPANTVVLDGVAMPITGAAIDGDNLNKGNYKMVLYTSEDKKKRVEILAGKAPHDGKTIDLTKKESAHEGWYWSVECYNPELIFDTYGGPDLSPYPVFLSGTLYVKHLGNEGGKPVLEIVLKNGRVKTEGKYGDGKEHTVSVNWKGGLKLDDF